MDIGGYTSGMTQNANPVQQLPSLVPARKLFQQQSTVDHMAAVLLEALPHLKDSKTCLVSDPKSSLKSVFPNDMTMYSINISL